ncbi:MAG: PKD domain-containing protein [Flavobacteriales bacterium]
MAFWMAPTRGMSQDCPINCGAFEPIISWTAESCEVEFSLMLAGDTAAIESITWFSNESFLGEGQKFSAPYSWVFGNHALEVQIGWMGENGTTCFCSSTLFLEEVASEVTDHCQCFPWNDSVSIGLSDDTGCTSVQTQMMLDLDSMLWDHYTVTWEVQGGDFAWVEQSDATSINPWIQFEDPVNYQIEATLHDIDSTHQCAISIEPLLVELAQAPTVSILNDLELCQEDEGTLHVLVNPGNTAITSFAWEVDSNVFESPFPAPLTHVFGEAGSEGIVAIAENECGSDSDTTWVEVHPTPQVQVASSHNWYCHGSYVDFVATGEGSFTWNSNSTLIQGGAEGDSLARYQVGHQVAGSVNTVVDHGTAQCSSSASFAVYGFFVPSVSLAAEPLECIGDSVDAVANIISYGWDTSIEWLIDEQPYDTTWAPTASVSTSVALGIPPEELSEGMHEISAAVIFDPYPVWLPDYGCADTVTHFIQIKSLPIVSALDGMIFCDQDFQEPLGSGWPEGGFWSTELSPVAESINPVDYGLGEHEAVYHYSDADGCSAQDSTTISIVNPTMAYAGTDTTLCEGSALVSIPVSQQQEQGVWSGPGVIPSTSTVDVSELNAGSNELVFSLGQGSCLTQDTTIWEVLEAPIALLSVDEEIACHGDTVWMEVQVIGGNLAEGSDYGYEWSGGLQFDANGLPFWVADASSGSSALNVFELLVIDGFGCSDESVVFVDAVQSPFIELPSLLNACTNDSIVTLPEAIPANGQWTGAGISGNSLNLSMLTSMSSFAVYSVVDENGCFGSDTLTIEAISPNALEFESKIDACFGVGTLALPELAGVEGVWTGPSISDEVPNQVDMQGLEVGLYTYYFEEVGVFCPAVDSIEIEIHALPVLALDVPTVSCPDSSLVFSVDPISNADAIMDIVWSVDNELVTSTETSFQTTWSAPGSHEISVAVTNEWGCSSMVQSDVIVGVPADASIEADILVCNQSIAVDLNEFVVTSEPGTSWFDGLGLDSGSVSESGLLNPGLLPIGQHAIVHLFEPEMGCASADTVMVHVNAPATLQTGADQSVCSNSGEMVLPLIASNGNVIWSAENEEATNSILDAGLGLIDVNALNTGTHAFIVSQGEASCWVTDTMLIDVLPEPAVQPFALPNLCSNQSETLLAEFSEISGIWQGIGILEPVQGLFAPMEAGPGVHSLELAFVDSLTLCSGEVILEIQVHAPIIPEVEVPSVLCALDTFSFNVSNATQFSQIQWFINENEIESGASIEYAASDSGFISIELSSIDVAGCVAVSNQTAWVDAVPSMEITSSVSSGCAPVQVVFEPNGNLNEMEWEWILDGVSMSNTSVFETSLDALETPQAYVVGLYWTHPCGTNTAYDTVQVLPAPQIEFLNSQPVACLYDSMEIQVATWYADEIQWDGAGLQSFDADSAVYFVDSQGTHEVHVIASLSETGCTTEALWNFEVHAAPMFNIEADQWEGCSPLEVNFSIDDTLETWHDWHWDFGDGFNDQGFSINAHQFHNESGAEEFLVSAQVHDPWGCVGSDSVLIALHPKPKNIWKLDTNVVCGLPSEWPIEELIPLGSSMQWLVNGDLALNGSSGKLTLNQMGWNHIESILVNEWGCSAHVTDSLNVLPLPTAELFVEPLMGCEPLEIDIHTTTGAQVLGHNVWFGDQLIHADEVLNGITLAQSGTYQLEVEVMSRNGCKGIIPMEVPVNVLASPEVYFDPIPYSGTLEAPSPYNSTWNFENYSDSGFAIWDFGDGNASTEWNGHHTYQNAGIFEVALLVSNDDGCTNEWITSIEILNPLQVFVPNAFTPSNQGVSDGINDGWRPEISGANLIEGYHLKVFNRYGNLVWQTNDPAAYWSGQVEADGQHFGQNEVYTWVLYIESQHQDPNQREWKGHVTLIR